MLIAPGLFFGGAAHTCFDAVGMIVARVLLGRYLKATAKGPQLLGKTEPDKTTIAETARIKRNGE